MLEMAIGDDNYPGDLVTSPNWPGVAPGESGREQRHLAEVLRRVRVRGHPDRPDVLWIRGDADQIVSDASLVDLGHLGALAWCPAGRARRSSRPQPMVTQMRVDARPVPGGGGRYTEHVLAGCGHSPHLERPAEFTAAVAGLLTTAGSARS